MAEAIREAEISISEGGLPIGAVLTRDRKIISRGYNRRMQEQINLLMFAFVRLYCLMSMIHWDRQ